MRRCSGSSCWVRRCARRRRLVHARGGGGRDGGGDGGAGPRRGGRGRHRATRRAGHWFGGVLSAIAIIPSAPVMVPNWRVPPRRRWPTCARPCVRPRRRCRRGGSSSGSGPPTRWSGRSGSARSPATASTCRCAVPDGDVAGELPLCALSPAGCVGRSNRRRAPRCGCTPTTTASTRRWPGPASCAPKSRRPPTPVGVLVVADGAHTLTAPAPGGYDPARSPSSAPSTRRWPAVTSRLARLPATIVGRVAYQVLAGLSEPAPRSARGSTAGARRRLFRRRLAAVTPCDPSRSSDRPDREVRAGAGGGRAARRRDR